MNLYASHVPDTYDGITCRICMGIVAPPGVTMTPEDGTLCTCGRAERAHETNPILVKVHEMSPDWHERFADVHIFDAANGAAWDEAGCPDDGPESDWWLVETHAYRVIERLAALVEVNA